MLEQKRAKYALDCIKAAKKLPEGERRRYTTLVKGLPAMIITNGLGQAAAFILADSSKGERRDADKGVALLYRQLSNWVVPKLNLPKDGGDQDLLKIICEGDRDNYLRAQSESLAFLKWLKRFAEAFLSGDSKSERENKGELGGN